MPVSSSTCIFAQGSVSYSAANATNAGKPCSVEGTLIVLQEILSRLPIDAVSKDIGGWNAKLSGNRHCQFPAHAI